jgi:hypothetical protein
LLGCGAGLTWWRTHVDRKFVYRIQPIS